MTTDTYKYILGLIINPIAGMGGSVGLKGTDGRDVLNKALELGAKPNALTRTREFLQELTSLKSKLLFYTSPKYMGAKVLKELGFDYIEIEDSIFSDYHNIFESTSEFTKITAEKFNSLKNLKLILFVGGDGTAIDIQTVIGLEKPCLGIPAGVKIFSSVFAVNPRDAATLTKQFLWDEIPLREAEVLDINENEYRENNLKSKLYGYLKIPYSPSYSQNSKMSTPDSDIDNQERIAERIVKNLEDNIYYLLGPGTTTKAITDRLNEKKTLLGIDILLNKKIIHYDVNESNILKLLPSKPFKIIVSPIGRQGFIFGRGNLQLSAEIIQKVGLENIIIISTKFKLNNIPDQILRIDTRNPIMDEKMRGFYRVITDYDEITICEVR